MADDYIRKQDAVEALDELRVNSLDAEKGLLLLSGIAAASDIIESLEPADVAPVRHGTWLPNIIRTVTAEQKWMERSVGMWFKYMCCLISLVGFYGFVKPSPNFEALSIAIVMCGFLIGKE